MQRAVYFITGSSGSGKTTLLKTIAEHLSPDFTYFHFDDNSERTVDDWFTAATSSPALTILDGSKRPTEVLAAADKLGVTWLKIVLIDCDHEERKRRLVKERGQPELDNLDMYAWAAYLRGQADALQLQVIDTTTAPIAESSDELLRSIEQFFTKIESLTPST